MRKWRKKECEENVENGAARNKKNGNPEFRIKNGKRYEWKKEKMNEINENWKGTNKERIGKERKIFKRQNKMKGKENFFN